MRVAIYGGLLYVFWLATLYLYWQETILFPTHVPPKPGATLYSPGTIAIRLDVQGVGPIEAWFVPADEKMAGFAPAPLAVLFHGNGQIIDRQARWIDRYLALGCSVLLPEYRGYGRSAGSPSQEAIVADAVRFVDEALKRDDVDTSRVLLHGRSLGGGVAAQVAARRKPTALILESTFTSVAAFAHKMLAPRLLVKHPFRTDRVVPNLDIPIFVIHGSRDTIVPVEHGRRLHELAAGSTYLELDGGHMLPERHHEQEYWRAIEQFLSRNGIMENQSR